MLRRIKGFSLIELLFVIAIIGIISIVAIPRGDQIGLSLEFQTQRLLNDLRYIQAMSMATGQRYYWEKVTSTNYQVADESGQMVMMPEGATHVSLVNQVQITNLQNLPNNLVAFDSLGAPYVSGGLSALALTNMGQIILSDGVRSKTISINAGTGFMEMQ